MLEDKQAAKNDDAPKRLSGQSFESKSQEGKENEDHSQEKSSGQPIETNEKAVADEDKTPIEPSKRILEYRKKISKEDYNLALSKISGRKRREKLYLFLSCAIAVILSSLITLHDYSENQYRYYSNQRTLFFYIIFFIGSGLIFFFISYLTSMAALESIYSAYQTDIDLYELENMQEEVEENLFESSLKMSYKYLDQYYAQTREQAKKGFLITIAVTLAGAVLIFAGIICMFINKIDASKITVASGVIVEFISAIMFYLYNRTIQSMGNYHDKLFLSQNVAIALKISDSLAEENRDKVKSQIVKELITNVNAYIVDSDNKSENNEATKESQ